MINDFYVLFDLFTILDSNTFAWKTQWKLLRILGELPSDAPVQSFHYFFMKTIKCSVFSLN